LIQPEVSLMHGRDRFSDETPIADAVEQEQETTLEPTASDREIPPVEADTSDWQEQHQEIVGADDDREDYRD
jgi:hypothetical protein